MLTLSPAAAIGSLGIAVAIGFALGVAFTLWVHHAASRSGPGRVSCPWLSR